MGNTASQHSPLEQCLSSVFTSNPSAVSFPSNPYYQIQYVKPYNLDISIIPAAVTRPSTAEEVAAVVECAVASGVKVQPRAGGHSYASYGLGGQDGVVVVDMVDFQQFSMDTSTWHATIGSGTLLGDVTARLHDAGGRAMAHGTCPQVGIGGHATIGGLGPSSRMWGAALDHVIEVEVVLANGTITRASDNLNSELFFALKGAAAGFGIITEFVVKTHPEPGEMVQYTYHIVPGSHTAMAGMFEAWQEMISDPNLTHKFASQLLVSELGMVISGTYFGSKAEYDALGLEKKLPKSTYVKTSVFTDWLGVVAHWAEDFMLKVGGGIAIPFYAKSLAFRNDTLIPSSGIKDLFNYFDTANKGTLAWAAIFDLQGGAINDVPPDATAYGHRDALFYVQTYAVGLPRVSQKTRNFLGGINQVILNSMPGVELGAYAGYVDPALKDPQEQYWGANLPRLENVKRKYDPQDVFHNPQSVRPATYDRPPIKSEILIQ